jgi:hypothetical protein
MMAVNVETASGFSAGVPKALFSTAGYPIIDLKYSVSPDGQRFLMFKRVAESASDDGPDEMSVVVVENWFQELERLAPATK